MFLISCRRERDNSEAERAQHLKQIHELQEHLREKESQFLALEEQVFFASYFCSTFYIVHVMSLCLHCHYISIFPQTGHSL